MKEIIIEVPDEFGKTLKPWKANAEIKGELVRCKNCKYLNAPVNRVPFCKRIKKFVDADWFCADGRRR